MHRSLKLIACFAVTLLASLFVVCRGGVAPDGRSSVDALAAATFSDRFSHRGGQPSWFNNNQNNQEEPGLFAVVIRLLFGRNSNGKKMHRNVNKGGVPAAATTRGMRYEVGTKKFHDLGTLAGVRSILLRVKARQAFYLLEGKLFQDELSANLTFAGRPKVISLKPQTDLTSLIGFVADEPNQLLAISSRDELVKVSIIDGKVQTIEKNLKPSDRWELSQQSVAPNAAIAYVDSPQNKVWNLLILPEGLNSPGAEILEVAGVKLDPRWSDDGSNLAFVQEQAAKEGTAKE